MWVYALSNPRGTQARLRAPHFVLLSGEQISSQVRPLNTSHYYFCFSFCRSIECPPAACLMSPPPARRRIGSD